MMKAIDLGGGRKAYIGDPEVLVGEYEHFEWLLEEWSRGSTIKRVCSHALAFVRAWEGFSEPPVWPDLPEDLTDGCVALKQRYGWLKQHIGLVGAREIAEAAQLAMGLKEETAKNSGRRSDTATSTAPAPTSSATSEST